MLAALHKLTKLAHFASGHDAALGRLFSTVTGLAVADQREEAVDQALELAPLRQLIAAGQFNDVTDAADAAQAASSFTIGGLPKFALYLSLLDDLIEPDPTDPDACEAVLPQLQSWWNDSNRNPESSAVLALAMARTGYAFDAQNSSWLSGSKYEDLRARYNDLARQVFADSAAKADDCYIWHRNHVRFGILEGAGAQEIGRRFHLALQHERYDIPLYLERAFSLVPQDQETNADLDTFALASVSRTRDRFGIMMYARIYSAVDDLTPLADLDIDRHLLMRGFADWFTHFPTQYLANRYAAVAHWTGDLEKVRELFNHHIRELHPTAWFDAAQPYIAWYEAGLSAGERKAVA